MELLMDRNRYRMCEDSYLLEEASNNPNAELALVLGERLEALLVEEAAAEERYTESRESYAREIDELIEKVFILETKINALEEKLNKEQNND